jgi:hypothetical protein
MESWVSSAVRYRNKATLVRMVAEDTKSGVVKALLLSVAQDYLRWAETLERRCQNGDDFA